MIAPARGERTDPAVDLRAARTRRRLRIGAIAALAYAGAVVVAAARAPDPGASVAYGGAVLAVEKGGPADAAGLRAGDRILAVDGVATANPRSAIDALDFARPARFTVAHRGAVRELQWSARRRFPIGSTAGALLAAALLALALLADRGAPSEARTFYRACLVYTIFLSGAFAWEVVLLVPWLALPWIASLAFAAPMTCHFMLRFPAGATLSRRQRALLYLPPLILTLLLSIYFLGFHINLLSHSAYQWGLALGAAAAALAALYLTAGAIARARRMRRRAGEVDRTAARWVQLAGIVEAAPILVGAGWAAVDARSFIARGLAPLGAAAVVGGSVCIVLAVTRVRFGELDRVLRRGSGHLLATTLAAALFLVVVAVPGSLAAAAGGRFATALGATLVAALVFGPLRARVQGAIDCRFARDRSRARRLLSEAARFAARTLDLDALARGTVERVREALSADGAALYVVEPDDSWLATARAGALPVEERIARRDPMAAALVIASGFGAPCEVAGGVVAAPIASSSGAAAALLVAASEARPLDGPDGEDGELLAALADGLAVALSNARAHGALRAATEKLKEEAANAERRRREIARLKERVEEEKQAIEAELVRRGGRAPVIGPDLRPTFDLVQRAARADATVLVAGETGTGKELVARALHAGSARRNGPFVVFDCGAVAPSLFESALFGHERGAFTGAERASRGAFRAANGGTLFLDEIGELPLELQPKLLRALESREVRPVGGAVETADVRVVAATQRDLQAESAAGRFRQDLLYRLKVIEIAVPPLRARRRDLLELAESFLREIAERRSIQPKRLAPDATVALLDYAWPGNVRELQHALEAAVVVSAGDELSAADLPIDGALFRQRGARAVSDGEKGLRETLDALERDRLIEALRAHRGNRTTTARALGLSRGALLRRLARYQIADDAN